jgi:hypothetical protein
MRVSCKTVLEMLISSKVITIDVVIMIAKRQFKLDLIIQMSSRKIKLDGIAEGTNGSI